MKHFCKEASQLASDLFERNLTFVERLRLRMHLAICDMCRNYSSNLSLLNNIFSGTRDQAKEDETCLSDEDRKQIEIALDQAAHHHH
ncbi:MAG: zf-HC2 domain-containing protein [Mariprofundaceae bacterium]